MKAAWAESFVIDRRYEKIRDLIFAFVWNLGDRDRASTFALTYPESLRIGETLAWTLTASWLKGGVYSTNKPSGKLKSLLEPYRMEPERWWALVTGP